MPKTPEEFLAGCPRMVCCTYYPEDGSLPFGALDVDNERGGLVNLQDALRAISEAQAEARAEGVREERERCSRIAKARTFIGPDATEYDRGWVRAARLIRDHIDDGRPFDPDRATSGEEGRT